MELWILEACGVYLGSADWPILCSMTLLMGMIRLSIVKFFLSERINVLLDSESSFSFNDSF
jgi:hypothetical protein